MNVAVVGTGLIGTSLGLALRRAGAARVVGWDLHAARLARARALGALDEAADSAEAATGAADVVVVAVPLPTVVDAACAALGAAPAAVVTDVASVKRPVVEALDVPRFCGAHPLAGAERGGPDAARADLFFGVICLLTPTERTSRAAIDAVERLWRAAGAEPIRVDAADHDAWLAATSHVPHLVAFALARLCAGVPRDAVAPSLREMTRVAASDAAAWSEILVRNAAAPGVLERLRAGLDEMARLCASGDSAALARLFEEGRTTREGWA